MRFLVLYMMQLLISMENKSYTYNICIFAFFFERGVNFGWTLRDMPEELKTTELCMVAVKQDGRALKAVPEDLAPTELMTVCRDAVLWHGSVRQFMGNYWEPTLLVAVKEAEAKFGVPTP